MLLKKKKLASSKVFFITALIAFTIATAVSLATLFNKNATAPQILEDNQKPVLPSSARTLVILVDSVPFQFMFDEKLMPFVAASRDRGAWGIAKILSAPITISCDKAIFSGHVENGILALSEDFSGVHCEHDNIFKRIKKLNKRGVIFSSDCIRGAFGDYTDLSVFTPSDNRFGEYKEEAKYVFEQSVKFLKSEDWDFAAIQFVSMDFVAHLSTPKSPEYRDLLPVIDEYIKQIVAQTTANDTVLITSEHGIDDNGVHMDMKPIVIDTPFVLWGPKVKKVANAQVQQPDWASTLSVLSGVNPVYPSSTLPMLELIDLSAEQENYLFEIFSKRFPSENAGKVTYESLREAQNLESKIAPTPIVSTFLILTIMLAIFLLVSTVEPASRYPRAVACSLAIIIITSILSYSGILLFITENMPFRADFIIHHPFMASMLVFAIALVTCLSFLLCSGKRKPFREPTALILLLSSLSAAFSCNDTYAMICWMILGGCLAGCVLKHNKNWFVISIAVACGFVIRRLTFINSFTPIPLPPMWILISILLVATLITLHFEKRKEGRQNQTMKDLAPHIVSLVIPLIISILQVSVLIRGSLLILSLIPMLYYFKKSTKEISIILAYWLSAYLLGTSSIINHMTYIVVFPIILCLWSEAKGQSNTIKGALFLFFILYLYVVPGNAFALKLTELIDPYLMDSASSAFIAPLILLITSRYVLPIAIFLAGMYLQDNDSRLLPVASIAVIPAIWTVGTKLSMLGYMGANAYPFLEMTPIIVFIAFDFTILMAFLTSQLISLATPIGAGFNRSNDADTLP